MIGYASSADKSGNCSKIIITVLDADDFAFEDYGCHKETYSVDRRLERVSKLEPDDGKINPPYMSLVKVAAMLITEELKCMRATRIRWNMHDGRKPMLVSASPLDGVWLPLPALNSKCEHPSVNITEYVFKSVPYPLEASLLCDVMNNLLLMCGIHASSPFCSCFNSVFCSTEIATVMTKLLGDEFMSLTQIKHPALQPAKKLKQAKASYKSVIKALENNGIPPACFDGNAHSFIVNLKRDCQKKTILEFASSIKRKSGYRSFFRDVAFCVAEAVMRITALAELFEVSGNLERATDIKYLTFYEAVEAFAFNESALSLKKTVRSSKLRQRDLNKMNIPLVVSADIK